MKTAIEYMQEVAGKAIRQQVVRGNVSTPDLLGIVVLIDPQLKVRLPGDDEPIVVEWVTDGYDLALGDTVEIERIGATFGVSRKWIRYEP